MPSCLSCHEPFENYRDLAVHIQSQKRGHGRGKKWAAKYLMENSLSAKSRYGLDLKPRTKITEEDRENKINTQRELSGENRPVKAICPKCRNSHQPIIPIEHKQSPHAWATGNFFFILCSNCRR